MLYRGTLFQKAERGGGLQYSDRRLLTSIDLFYLPFWQDFILYKNSRLFKCFFLFFSSSLLHDAKLKEVYKLRLTPKWLCGLWN